MVLSRPYDPFSPQVQETTSDLEVPETPAPEATSPKPKRRRPRAAKQRRVPSTETEPLREDGDDIARALNEKLAELEDQ